MFILWMEVRPISLESGDLKTASILKRNGSLRGVKTFQSALNYRVFRVKYHRENSCVRLLNGFSLGFYKSHENFGKPALSSVSSILVSLKFVPFKRKG